MANQIKMDKWDLFQLNPFFYIFSYDVFVYSICIALDPLGQV